MLQIFAYFERIQIVQKLEPTVQKFLPETVRLPDSVSHSIFLFIMALQMTL